MKKLLRLRKLRHWWRRLTGQNLIDSSVYPCFEEFQEEELHFYRHTLKPGMVAFDVGANDGGMTRVFLKLVGRRGAVHSFEPGKEAFEQLKAVESDFHGYCLKVNRLALSDAVGELSLNVYAAGYSSWNTLANRQESMVGQSPIGVEKIQSTTLDQYCLDAQVPHIDFLKIDVEGAEYQVLCGAQDMLSQRKISTCLFEYGTTTWDMGNQPQDLTEILNRHGYKMRNLFSGQPLFGGGNDAQSAAYGLIVAHPN